MHVQLLGRDTGWDGVNFGPDWPNLSRKKPSGPTPRRKGESGTLCRRVKVSDKRLALLTERVEGLLRFGRVAAQGGPT